MVSRSRKIICMTHISLLFSKKMQMIGVSQNYIGWFKPPQSGGSHKLLVDGPYASQICGLIPSVQHRNHSSNPLEICFEHLFQIVTTAAALFHKDSVLVVGEEAHEKVTGANQVFLKRLQSAPDLHAISWAIGVVSMYLKRFRKIETSGTCCPVWITGVRWNFLFASCVNSKRKLNEKHPRIIFFLCFRQLKIVWAIRSWTARHMWWKCSQGKSRK